MLVGTPISPSVVAMPSFRSDLTHYDVVRQRAQILAGTRIEGTRRLRKVSDPRQPRGTHV